PPHTHTHTPHAHAHARRHASMHARTHTHTHTHTSHAHTHTHTRQTTERNTHNGRRCTYKKDFVITWDTAQHLATLSARQDSAATALQKQPHSTAPPAPTAP